MDFFEQYKHPFLESSLADYPIVQACINGANVLPKGAIRKGGNQEVLDCIRTECEEIFRYIFYRYHRESPIYARKMSMQSRDERALENSEMSRETYELFQKGDKFLLSLVLAFLKEECDRDWQDYQAKITSYNQAQKMVFEFDKESLEARDTLAQTEKLQKANAAISMFSKEIQVLEAQLFGYNREDSTAISKELSKYAPKLIENILVDLIKYPCEYFADKTRDTMFNNNPEPKRASHYQNGKKKNHNPKPD